MTKINNYELLIEKLDAFIRKFYINQLFRGTLYFLGFILAAFLLASVLEGSFYFGTTGRKIIFISFISTAVLFFIIGLERHC